MRASCFLNDYMKNGGYTNLIEAVGIIYSLTLLAKSIKENVKKIKGGILELLELSISITEVKYDFYTAYSSIEMLWNIILNNFNINDFSESEFKHLQKLYSRSLEIIEENEELFARTKEFFKKSKINFKLKEKDYLTLYFSLLKLEEFNWTLEKLIDIYNYCATIGKLKCLYKILYLKSNAPIDIIRDKLIRI